MESIRLKKELPAGSYSCTARIFAYKLDGETYIIVRQSDILAVVE